MSERLNPSSHEHPFVSTRGVGGTYSNTLTEGLAPDGGLFMPVTTPEPFDPDFFERLPSLWLHEVSAALARKFIPPDCVDDKTLSDMMERAHDFDIPVVSIDQNTHVALLDQADTAAFKDIAMRELAELMAHQLGGERKNMLGATSGDTGVAGAYAFAPHPTFTTTIMYPTSGVSEVQEVHMLQAAQDHSNVQVIPVQGQFSRAQDISSLLLEAGRLEAEDGQKVAYMRQKIASMLGEELKDDQVSQMMRDAKEVNLGSFNSINLWRLTPQLLQYFYSYGELVRQGKIQAGQEAVFAVPTGNAGHLMAGMLARDMGLPISKLVAGTNQNNVLSNIIGGGMVRHNGSQSTYAPAMDIKVPNNLERILWYAAQKVDPKSGIDFEGLKTAIREFQPGQEGIPLERFGVSQKVISYLQGFIFTDDVRDDSQIARTMKEVHEASEGRVTLDPHGASAMSALRAAREQEFIGEGDQVIVFKTANEAKFPVPMAAAGLSIQHDHHELSKLRGLTVSDFDKPEVATGILDVMRRVRALATVSLKAAE